MPVALRVLLVIVAHVLQILHYECLLLPPQQVVVKRAPQILAFPTASAGSALVGAAVVGVAEYVRRLPHHRSCTVPSPHSRILSHALASSPRLQPSTSSKECERWLSGPRFQPDSLRLAPDRWRWPALAPAQRPLRSTVPAALARPRELGQRARSRCCWERQRRSALPVTRPDDPDPLGHPAAYGPHRRPQPALHQLQHYQQQRRRRATQSLGRCESSARVRRRPGSGRARSPRRPPATRERHQQRPRRSRRRRRDRSF